MCVHKSCNWLIERRLQGQSRGVYDKRTTSLVTVFFEGHQAVGVQKNCKTHRRVPNLVVPGEETFARHCHLSGRAQLYKSRRHPTTPA